MREHYKSRGIIECALKSIKERDLTELALEALRYEAGEPLEELRNLNSIISSIQKNLNMSINISVEETANLIVRSIYRETAKRWVNSGKAFEGLNELELEENERSLIGRAMVGKATAAG